jgi:hypothetical protein
MRQVENDESEKEQARQSHRSGKDRRLHRSKNGVLLRVGGEVLLPHEHGKPDVHGHRRQHAEAHKP